MARIYRDYTKDQNSASGLPSVPTDSNDFDGVKRLLEALRTQASAFILASHTPTPVIETATSGFSETGILPAPSTPTLAILSANVASLTWEPYVDPFASSLDFYRVYRNTVNDFPTALVYASSGTSFAVDSGLTTATTYYFWITSVSKSEQESPASNVVSGTTP